MATTVILGSGIIGLSTAFYLSKSQPGSSIHLLDSSTELFASASGYAGGFLAKDWFGPGSASLGQLSFEEHRKLSNEYGGKEKWGYSRTKTVSYDEKQRKRKKINPRRGAGGGLELGGAPTAEDNDSRRGTQDPDLPAWLKTTAGTSVEVMDTGDGTAIVDPLQLCHFLLKKCKENGVHLHHPATAHSITKDVRGELAAVTIGSVNPSNEIEIPATRILIAAGAWSPAIFKSLFPTSSKEIPIGYYAGNSLVVRNPAADGPGSDCAAVYTGFEDLAPELYSRSSGVIYIAGVNEPHAALPHLATESRPGDQSIERLMKIAEEFIKTDSKLEVVRKGLCFRPITREGAPVLDRIKDEDLGIAMSTRPGPEGGVFLAAGHGPWGISLSLGTGRVMAEMMQGRELSADISRLKLR